MPKGKKKRQLIIIGNSINIFGWLGKRTRTKRVKEQSFVSIKQYSDDLILIQASAQTLIYLKIVDCINQAKRKVKSKEIDHILVEPKVARALFLVGIITTNGRKDKKISHDESMVMFHDVKFADVAGKKTFDIKVVERPNYNIAVIHKDSSILSATD